MTRQFTNILSLIVAGAIVALAGSAFAQVPEGAWDTTDKKEPLIMAFGQTTGGFNFSYVEAICEDFDDSDSATTGSGVYVETDQIDEVKLKKEKITHEQSRKGNQADVYVITGSGDGQLENMLNCEKAEISNEIDTKKSDGKFEASGKNCVCDEDESDDCDELSNQIGKLAVDCENVKGLSGSFKDGDIKKFKAKGKGNAVELN